MSEHAIAPSAKADLVPAISEPRLPYHPGLEDRFGIDKTSWRALVESTFPTATSQSSVILALSYCKARQLDVFKRVVHIVPIWDKNRKCMVDTVWPGIAEYRTTAFRTGVYAGKDATEVGPILSEKVGGKNITFPEWMRITVFRIVVGERTAFPGPCVYWKETFASTKDGSPNSMWGTRPFGMLEKCAEAAALRCAFPEELGGEPIAEEVGRMWHGRASVDAESTPVSDGMIPKPAALPKPTTPPIEPTPEPIEQPDPVPAEKTEAELESAPLVEEYREAIGQTDAVGDVARLRAEAEDNPRLTPEDKEKVNTIANLRCGVIRSGRGAQSNKPTQP